jgi:hypothetical protein
VETDTLWIEMKRPKGPITVTGESAEKDANALEHVGFPELWTTSVVRRCATRNLKIRIAATQASDRGDEAVVDRDDEGRG